MESVRGEIDREGRVVSGGGAFRTVEGPVDKARQDRGARRERRPDPQKAWACVVHARTGKRLHALLNEPSKRKRPPQSVSGRPPRVRGKMTANYSGYTYCGNSWWTRDDLMADRSVRQRKRPATDEAPRPRRRKPTPKVQQPLPPRITSGGRVDAPRGLLAREHRVRTRQRPSTGGRRAGAGADGRPGRTQKSVGRGLLHGRGLLGRAVHGRAHGLWIRRAGRRAAVATTTVESEGRFARVAQLMEGLNAHQFDPHALVACERTARKSKGQKPWKKRRSSRCRCRCTPTWRFSATCTRICAMRRSSGCLGGAGTPATRRCTCRRRFLVGLCRGMMMALPMWRWIPSQNYKSEK